MAGRFNLSSIMAPIGKPMSISGVGGNKSNSKVSGGFMPQPAFDPSNLQRQIGGLQEQIGNLPSFDPSQFATRDDLENRPIYDDTDLRNQITSIEQRLGFDDTALRQMIEANSNKPQFDASGLQSQIGGLQDQFKNLPQFDDSQLQSQISGLQNQFSNMPQFDDSNLRQMIEQNANRPSFDASGLQSQIGGLEDRLSNIPQFDDSDLRQMIEQNKNRPGFDASGLQSQIGGIEDRLSNLPQFDDSSLRQMIEQNKNRPQFDPSALQNRLQNLENRDLPQFDPSKLQQGIAGLEDRFKNLPQFDPSALQNRLKQLEGRETPTFDPSALKDRLATLEGRELPQFDPSQLQSGIAGLQERIQNLPQFDPSQLQNRLKTLEGRELPKFNPQDFRDDFLSIAREGVQMPEYQAPDLSGFARKEDIPQFDRQKLIEEIQSGINIPQPQVPDMSAFESRFADMQKRIEELSQNQISEQLPLGNTGSEFVMPEPDPVQYLGGSADFNEQGPSFDPTKMPAAPIVQEPIGGGIIGGQLGGITGTPLQPPTPEEQARMDAGAARRQEQNQLSQQRRAGNDTFFAAFPDAPQPPRMGTMDRRMYIDPITGEQKEGSSTDVQYRNRLKEYLDANPAAQESYTQNVTSIAPPSNNQRPPFGRPGRQPISIGGPSGGITSIGQIGQDTRIPNMGNENPVPFDPNTPGLPRLPSGQQPVPPQDFGFGPGIRPSEITTADGQFIGSGGITPPSGAKQAVDPATGQPYTPTQEPEVGSDLMRPQGLSDIQASNSTQTQIPTGPNQIDPVLLQQATSEQVGDPLLRSLYFGTADSPGFYNQLQQAGANLIGSDVPLQQTAGLSPLELLARKQAVAGLGGFEPFLQQNRDLVNQAIEQSRRAEELQDPYYSQAEEIFKDTMGGYDPSMTQQFYNPYEDQVVQQTIDDVMKSGDKQDIASRAREISSGAFGGSRARLGAEERRESLGKGLAQALGNIRSQGFQSAQQTGLSEFARQQQAKRTGAQGLMGIGVGRGSAASNLGQQLAGYGGQMSGIGSTQEGLRAGQRGELAGYGGIGRGIAETGLGRIFEQQVGQQYRPMQTLGQIAGMLPGYQASGSQIDSQYGMPTDPTAAGLGAAFSAYGAMAPRQGQS